MSGDDPAPGADPGAEDASPPTFWEGEPAEARRVSIIVADDPRFPVYWATALIGQRRDAVEVTFRGQTFYLDDERYVDASASGWEKVTVGRGRPDHGHRELAAEPGSVEERRPAGAAEPEPAAADQTPAKSEPGPGTGSAGEG